MKADKRQTISAAEFDRRFDDGEAMDDFVDWDQLRDPISRPNV